MRSKEPEKSTSLSMLSLCCGLMIVTVLSGRPPLAMSATRTAKPAIIRAPRKMGVEKYPYSSRRFSTLIADSSQYCKPGETRDFRKWLDEAYRKSPARFPGKENLSLAQLIAIKRKDMSAIKDNWKKTQTQIALAAWLHKMIKSVIPKFSLERGFEFCYTVQYGERQCFLQSVLIAGLLQDMGVDAGIAMVYLNERSEETNNGHAVTLVKLPIGQDIIVDASEPYPFAAQQGLFVRHGSYQYVRPVYLRYSHRIVRYKAAANSQPIAPAQVRTMDYNFVRSQFYYYRGERTKGALLSDTKTPNGLEAAANALRISVGYSSQNPLAVYMLGRVYWSQGKFPQARAFFERAARLYTKFGWLPGGPKEYLQLSRQQLAPAPAPARQ